MISYGNIARFLPLPHRSNTGLMKTSILLLAAIFLFAACKKEAKIEPKTSLGEQSAASKPKSISTPPIAAAARDTIPDKALLKIKLTKDNVNYDETMFVFNHTASLSYDPNYDSPYFSGYGQESLASISADGRDLVIHSLHYSPRMSVGLDVNTIADGAFSLLISYQNKIPTDIEIMIVDNHLNNSADLSTGPYKFNIVRSDTSTYGSNRFKLVFKARGH